MDLRGVMGYDPEERAGIGQYYFHTLYLATKLGEKGAGPQPTLSGSLKNFCPDHPTVERPKKMKAQFWSDVANTRTSALVESGYGRSPCIRTACDCLGNFGRIHPIRRSLARRPCVDGQVDGPFVLVIRGDTVVRLRRCRAGGPSFRVARSAPGYPG